MSPEIEDIDNQEDSNSDSQTLSRATAAIDVLIDGKEPEITVISIQFVEEAFEHYVLSVTLAPDVGSNAESAVAPPANNSSKCAVPAASTVWFAAPSGS